MPSVSQPKITPCLWYSSQAEQAAGDQAEVDRYWNALQEGGTPEQCGWLRDRYGLMWQIVPTLLSQLMADTDRVRAKRVTDAMMQMVKIDIATLLAAHAGRAG